MGRINVRWSEEELKVLGRMLDAGASHAEIAKALCVDAERVKARVCYQNRDEAQRKRRRDGINSARAARRSGETPAKIYGGSATTAGRPTPAMLDAATGRLLAPRSLTSSHFGDPPPGYSALDRKRSGTEPAAYIDHRLAQLQRKPSLAGRLA